MTVTLISTPPAVVTPEQTIQLQDSGLMPEIAHHVQPNVRILITPPMFDAVLGKGTLYVTESKLYFFSRDTNNGLAIDYPSIIMHAISRQALDDTGPCIYTQLDIEPNSLTSANQSTENPTEDGDRDEMTEMKFIPDDTNSLDAIFEALSECAALHPDKGYMEEDPDNEFYGNGDNDEWITAAPSDEQELSEVGSASLAYLDSIIDQPNLTEQQRTSPDTNEHDKEMFEDAEE
ncbi:23689_t:CDS:2 [Cetraspora pellucida]|uniref:23689_t:CDS:1 n=1 Tax=Cetraspora pellucida TaxID=1433469 RepID=A0A9N9DE86_9GLOM|nr:23689_t:CDS:2 [Cetraspora pellucida]